MKIARWQGIATVTLVAMSAVSWSLCYTGTDFSFTPGGTCSQGPLCTTCTDDSLIKDGGCKDPKIQLEACADIQSQPLINYSPKIPGCWPSRGSCSSGCSFIGYQDTMVNSANNNVGNGGCHDL